MFVDADKIVLSNIDDLFKLPAPAATFSNPWAEPFIGVRQSGTRGGTALMELTCGIGPSPREKNRHKNMRNNT